jgi:hypothetical protein
MGYRSANDLGNSFTEKGGVEEAGGQKKNESNNNMQHKDTAATHGEDDDFAAEAKRRAGEASAESIASKFAAEAADHCLTCGATLASSARAAG